RAEGRFAVAIETVVERASHREPCYFKTRTGHPDSGSHDPVQRINGHAKGNPVVVEGNGLLAVAVEASIKCARDGESRYGHDGIRTVIRVSCTGDNHSVQRVDGYGVRIIIGNAEGEGDNTGPTE